MQLLERSVFVQSIAVQPKRITGRTAPTPTSFDDLAAHRRVAQFPIRTRSRTARALVTRKYEFVYIAEIFLIRTGTYSLVSEVSMAFDPGIRFGNGQLAPSLPDWNPVMSLLAP